MRAPVALILAISSSASLAADDPTLAAARRLVDMLQIDAIYQDALGACGDATDAASSARQSDEANPRAFGGMSPRSAYWPEVEDLYRRYRMEACGATTARIAKEIYVKVFAQRLPREELERAAAQMATPESRALQAASREAARMLSVHQATEQELATAAAALRFREKMLELSARYKADPR